MYVTLGEDRVKWSGGRKGDVNEEGIPYGTLTSEVPKIKAALLAEKQQLAVATSPWANVFGSGGFTNPLNMDTTTLAMYAAGALIGLFALKKYVFKKKGK